MARALGDLYHTRFEPAQLTATQPAGALAADGARRLSGRSGASQVSLARARKAWVPDGAGLVPAWIVEAYSRNASTADDDAYRTVIAADGRVLSLVQDHVCAVDEQALNVQLAHGSAWS